MLLAYPTSVIWLLVSKIISALLQVETFSVSEGKEVVGGNKLKAEKDVGWKNVKCEEGLSLTAALMY